MNPTRKPKSLPDTRYNVALEYCGQRTRQPVTRYCGEWLGKADTIDGAVAIARNHRAGILRAIR